MELRLSSSSLMKRFVCPRTTTPTTTALSRRQTSLEWRLNGDVSDRLKTGLCRRWPLSRIYGHSALSASQRLQRRLLPQRWSWCSSIRRRTLGVGVRHRIPGTSDELRHSVCGKQGLENCKHWCHCSRETTSRSSYAVQVSVRHCMSIRLMAMFLLIWLSVINDESETFVRTLTRNQSLPEMDIYSIRFNFWAWKKCNWSDKLILLSIWSS